MPFWFPNVLFSGNCFNPAILNSQLSNCKSFNDCFICRVLLRMKCEVCFEKNFFHADDRESVTIRVEKRAGGCYLTVK